MVQNTTATPIPNEVVSVWMIVLFTNTYVLLSVDILTTENSALGTIIYNPWICEGVSVCKKQEWKTAENNELGHSGIKQKAIIINRLMYQSYRTPTIAWLL